MSDLSQRFKSIIEDVEQNLKNQEDLDFVKQKISEVSVLFLDTIDKLISMNEQRIQNIEAKQKDIDQKIQGIDNAVSEMEKDIYVEDDEENYDFEIVCPYCNHEFTCDLETTGKDEIQCPECKNMIELDWNMEEECSGDCCGCHADCNEEEVEEKSEQLNEQQQEKPEENEQEDDM